MVKLHQTKNVRREDTETVGSPCSLFLKSRAVVCRIQVLHLPLVILLQMQSPVCLSTLHVLSNKGFLITDWLLKVALYNIPSKIALYNIPLKYEFDLFLNLL